MLKNIPLVKFFVGSLATITVAWLVLTVGFFPTVSVLAAGATFAFLITVFYVAIVYFAKWAPQWLQPNLLFTTTFITSVVIIATALSVLGLFGLFVVLVFAAGTTFSYWTFITNRTKKTAAIQIYSAQK